MERRRPRRGGGRRPESRPGSEPRRCLLLPSATSPLRRYRWARKRFTVAWIGESGSTGNVQKRDRTSTPWPKFRADARSSCGNEFGRPTVAVVDRAGAPSVGLLAPPALESHGWMKRGKLAIALCVCGHQQEIQADRDQKLLAAREAAEEPPAGRVTDETDYFRVADFSGVIRWPTMLVNSLCLL